MGIRRIPAYHVDYTTGSYLRFGNEQGDIHCSLLMEKSRVAPLKVTKISRLELTAAVVSVAVNDMLKEEMNSGGQSTQIKYLSKSTDTYNKILLQ